MDLEEIELSVKGWNWGTAKFKGQFVKLNLVSSISSTGLNAAALSRFCIDVRVPKKSVEQLTDYRHQNFRLLQVLRGLIQQYGFLVGLKAHLNCFNN